MSSCKVSVPSPRLRLGLTMIIVLALMSSPVFTLFSPALIAAPVSTDVSTSFAPSTLSQGADSDQDFTTQAALTLTRTAQTSNIVNSKAYYDIMFRTSVTGNIKTIVMDFPAGTYVGAASLVEAVGIGPGTIAASAGEKITYTVTEVKSVPSNTNIRIQLANINNPSIPSSGLVVTLTTKNPGGSTIDGPTATSVYNIKQIGTNDIADGAITESKLASDISASPPFVYLTFDGCQGTNQNHDVTCQVHDETGITEIDCDVADPAILGGVNVGDCFANTG